MSKTKPEVGEVWNWSASKIGSPVTIIGYLSSGQVVYQLNENPHPEYSTVLHFTKFYKLRVPKKVLYVNVYKHGLGGAHITLNSAKSGSEFNPDLVARVRAEYEDGQFDD